jgi:hypothetical protein
MIKDLYDFEGLHNDIRQQVEKVYTSLNDLYQQGHDLESLTDIKLSFTDIIVIPCFENI